MKCPYCSAYVELVDSVKVYGRSFGMLLVCSNYPLCDSYVGVHRRNNKPLGSLANKELREARKAAHAAFDVRWQVLVDFQNMPKRMARSMAYARLAKEMGMPADLCHIGMMDVEQCGRVVGVCQR